MDPRLAIAFTCFSVTPLTPGCVHHVCVFFKHIYSPMILNSQPAEVWTQHNRWAIPLSFLGFSQSSGLLFISSICQHLLRAFSSVFQATSSTIRSLSGTLYAVGQSPCASITKESSVRRRHTLRARDCTQFMCSRVCVGIFSCGHVRHPSLSKTDVAGMGLRSQIAVFMDFPCICWRCILNISYSKHQGSQVERRSERLSHAGREIEARVRKI